MASIKTDVLQGKISNISSGIELFGRADRGNGISQTNTWTFRIDKKPVSFKTKQNLNFSEGDFITAVGGENNGTFNVTALRNDTTGQIFEPTVGVAKFLGWGLVILGIITIFIFVGFVLIPLGVFFIWASRGGAKAVEILKHTPSAQTSL